MLGKSELRVELGVFRNDNQVINCVQAKTHCIELSFVWNLKRDSHVSSSIVYHKVATETRRHREEFKHDFFLS